jgi:hypothetical protein
MQQYYDYSSLSLAARVGRNSLRIAPHGMFLFRRITLH